MLKFCIVLLFLLVQALAEKTQGSVLADRENPLGQLAKLMLAAEPKSAFNALRPGMSASPAASSLVRMQGVATEIEPGQIVAGVVRKVGKTKLGIDIGTGKTAVLYNADYSENEDFPDLTTKVKVGSKLRARVKRVNPVTKRVKLSIRKEPATALEDLDVGQAFEGMVTKLSKSGAYIDIGAERLGLLPAEEANMLKRGQIIDGFVSSCDPSEDRLLVTTRDLSRFSITDLEVGQPVEGQVVKVGDFGVIVDIGASEPVLLPVGQIFLDLPEDPLVELRQMYSPGDDISGRVISIDQQTGRCEMTSRLLREDFEAGQMVDCRVERINRHGLWVDIGAEEQALLGTRAIRSSQFIDEEELNDMFSVGDILTVKIAEVNDQHIVLAKGKGRR